MPNIFIFLKDIMYFIIQYTFKDKMGSHHTHRHAHIHVKTLKTHKKVLKKLKK